MPRLQILREPRARVGHGTAALGRAALGRAAFGRAALALAVGLTAACSSRDLLDVRSPSRLDEASFLVPQNAALIVNSAIGDLTCAFGSYVVASGLAAGELQDGTQTAARWSYDRRDVLAGDLTYSASGCAALGVYTPISTARFTLDQALGRLETWTDQEVVNRQLLIARAALHAGFAYDLLAEGFCTATVNEGAEMQPRQLFDSAEVRFTRAITAATALGNADLLNAARVGRARVRLYTGNAAGAIADATPVPVTFAFTLTTLANDARRVNRVFEQNNQAFAVSVAPAYRTLNDPRVRVTDAGRNAQDQTTRLWTQQKYGALATALPIATGVEAQLILAEAQGAAGGGVATLNALRGRTGIALPALTTDEAAAFGATLYEERRRELFLQGARWYDLRRGNLALVPAPQTAYVKGGSYGDQRCWPLPDIERAANPNL